MNLFFKYSVIFITMPWLLIFLFDLTKRKQWKYTSIYFLVTTGFALFSFYFLHYDVATSFSAGGSWRFPISAQLILVFSKLLLALWAAVFVLQKKGILRSSAESYALASSAALAILLNWSMYEHI